MKPHSEICFYLILFKNRNLLYIWKIIMLMEQISEMNFDFTKRQDKEL